MKPWLVLAKPRITVLVSLCAAAGYAIAPHDPDAPRFWWTILGVALASASTGCLNQVLEAEQDARMERTRARPIPSGQISPAAAHALGLVWGGMGLGLLAWKVNAAACGLTAFTLASYLLVYTPMKRFSPLSTWVGAIPGALPPVIGWAAAGGPLDARALSLFAIQFLWQMPHFLALAWMHREDYARGGFRVLAVQDPDGAATSSQITATAALLALAGAAPYGLGLAGGLYLAGALALGAWFLHVCVTATRSLSPASARRVFLSSLAYLPLALALLVFAR